MLKTKKRRQIASYRRLIGRRDSDSSTIPFYFQSTSDPSSPLSRLNLGSGKNRSSIPTLSELSIRGSLVANLVESSAVIGYSLVHLHGQTSSGRFEYCIMKLSQPEPSPNHL